MWLWLIGFRHLWEGPFLAFTWRVSLFKLFKRVDLLSLVFLSSSFSSSFQTSWALLDTRGINRESPAGNTCRGELCRLGFSPGPGARSSRRRTRFVSLLVIPFSLSLIPFHFFFFQRRRNGGSFFCPIHRIPACVYNPSLRCTALCCHRL